MSRSWTPPRLRALADPVGPGFPTGALVGLCATAALAAVSYVAWRGAGLPFLPYEAFDWISRQLPVHLVAFGMDARVAAIGLLGIEDAAGMGRAGGQALAVGTFALTGAVLAGLLFTGLRRTETVAPRWIGFAFGMLAAILLALVHVSVDATGGASTTLSLLWIFVALPPWGLTIGWSFERLVHHARAVAAGHASIELVDRRRFLVQLGGATTLIALAGALVGRALSGPDKTHTSGGSP